MVGARVPAASACSCVQIDESEAFARATHVFVGSLREVRKPLISLHRGDQNPSRYLFDVKQVFKGAVHEIQSVVQPPEDGTCGMSFGDEPMLIFAFAPGLSGGDFVKPIDGEVVTSLCAGNRTVSGDVPAAFGSGWPPTAGSSPIGHDATARLVSWAVIALIAALVAAVVAVLIRSHRRRAGAVNAAG